MSCRGGLQSVCRICGRVGRRYCDVFNNQKEEKPALLELILKCLDLEIKQDDGLPRRICGSCSRKLAAWQAFRKTCFQTQARILREFSKRNEAEFSPSECQSESTGLRYRKVRITRPDKQKSRKSTIRKSKSKKNKKYEMPDSKVQFTEHDATVRHMEHEAAEETAVPSGSFADEHSTVESSDRSVLQAVKTETVPESATTNDLAMDPTPASTTNTEATMKTSRKVSHGDPRTTKAPAVLETCDTCNRLFRDGEALARHIASQHAEHRCPVCKKLFKNKFSLRSHAFVHADRRHFCCHVCGRLFRTASCLCNHVRAQHGGDGGEGSRRPFECPHCSKLFGQRFHLAQHMRSHTGERPFACPDCPQRFTTRCQLTRHQRGRHQRDDRFACEHCGRRFRYSSNYKVHLQAHEGHTLQCADCDRSFSSTNGLLRHRRLHTGEKPFPCSVCGKRFADCSNRKRHMARHEAGPRPPRAPRAPRTRKTAASAIDAEILASQSGLAPSSVLSTTVLPFPATVIQTSATVLHGPPAVIPTSDNFVSSSAVSTFLPATTAASVPMMPLQTNVISASAAPNVSSISSSAFLASAPAPTQDRIPSFSALPVPNSILPNPSPATALCSNPATSGLAPPLAVAAKSTSPIDDGRPFSSLRAFLESSEVAALADSSQHAPAPQPAPPPQAQVAAQLATEVLTLLTTAEGDVQQVIYLPVGLLDALETEPTAGSSQQLLPQPLPPPPPLPLPSSHPPSVLPSIESQTPMPAPPLGLLDKEAIVRMLNSQGTTIA